MWPWHQLVPAAGGPLCPVWSVCLGADAAGRERPCCLVCLGLRLPWLGARACLRSRSVCAHCLVVFVSFQTSRFCALPPDSALSQVPPPVQVLGQRCPCDLECEDVCGLIAGALGAGSVGRSLQSRVSWRWWGRCPRAHVLWWELAAPAAANTLSSLVDPGAGTGSGTGASWREMPTAGELQGACSRVRRG